jgi:hypothetical protein
VNRSGVWRAEIITTSLGLVWVRIPKLDPDGRYGPCETVELGAGATPYAADDRVLVAELESDPGTFVVVGRLP